jgi:hypothetical protein
MHATNEKLEHISTPQSVISWVEDRAGHLSGRTTYGLGVIWIV